jgi:hypothetical protein
MLPVLSRGNDKRQARLRSRHRSPVHLTSTISSCRRLGRRAAVRSPLDHPRNHSSHYRVRRRDCHRLDDRYHRLDSGRDTRAARDGWSRGRRPETLLLSAPAARRRCWPAGAGQPACTLALRTSSNASPCRRPFHSRSPRIVRHSWQADDLRRVALSSGAAGALKLRCCSGPRQMQRRTAAEGRARSFLSPGTRTGPGRCQGQRLLRN